MLRTEIKVPPKLQEIIKKLAATQEAVIPLVVAAVKTSGIAIKDGARKTCPFMTGALQNSIDVEFTDGGLCALISSYLPYAAKWEFSEVAHPIHPRSKTGKKTGNENPNAEWGYLRKNLLREQPVFIQKLKDIARNFLK